MTTQTPTSSAGPSIRVEPPPAQPPARPGLRHLPGIVMAGLPTLVFAALMAGALALPFFGHFRPAPRVAEVLIFSVIPALGLAVFARVWWRSIRALGREAPSWSFLCVPFFVVLGIAAGLAFVRAATTDAEGPGAFIVRTTCRDLPDADDDAVARCETAGRACADRLIVEGRDTPDDLRACILAR